MLRELELYEWHPMRLAAKFDVSYEYACDRLTYIQNRIEANYLAEQEKNFINILPINSNIN